MNKISKEKYEEISNFFYNDIKNIIVEARTRAIKSADTERVLMYWKIGRRIQVEEQQDKDRADYGTFLIKGLSKTIEPEFGTGFSIRQLSYCRQFYRMYPSIDKLKSQFNWYQYKLLSSIVDDNKREYYELETLHNNWNGKELERQINSSLYERLLMSNDKEDVLAVARKERIPQSPSEIIKDPMFLEFLGLNRDAKYYESDLESAIITHLQSFLLELGNGFSFVARQKRILLEDDEFFVDLVFYNRLLKCFVIIEIKTKKITHNDIGQLQMYVNYYDRVVKNEDENDTVGILLCANKNESVVKMTLPLDNKAIMTSQYRSYLPTENDLLDEIKEVIHFVDRKCEANI